jgi:hypothetical protein
VRRAEDLDGHQTKNTTSSLNTEAYVQLLVGEGWSDVAHKLSDAMEISIYLTNWQSWSSAAYHVHGDSAMLEPVTMHHCTAQYSEHSIYSTFKLLRLDKCHPKNISHHTTGCGIERGEYKNNNN